MLTFPKYIFSQMIEVGRVPDDRGRNILLVMEIDDAVMKVKKLFYPEVIRTYNLQTKKAFNDNNKLIIEKAGDNKLLLSINSQLENLDKYKLIFQKIIDLIVDETKHKLIFIETF